MSIRLTRRGCIVSATVMVIARGASAGQMRKITIGIASTSLSGGVARIANQMGLFEKHGFDAKIIAMDNGSVATMALISGSLDFTTGGGTEVVIAQAHGQNIVSITPVYGRFGAVVVLSKAVAEKLGVSSDAPLPERLKALDGLVIATPAVTATSTLALKPTAESVGAKVRFTYMNFPAMTAALKTGAIQGFIASSPYYAEPVRNGSGVLWISGPKGEFPPQYTPANYSVLNTRRDFAEANPNVITRIAAVFSDFTKAVDARPAAVKAAVAALFPGLDAPTIDLLFETESPGFRTKPLTVEDLAHEIAFVRSNGLLPTGENLDPKSMLLKRAGAGAGVAE
jgi:ABC-type nitrate/sulfonate/bicarbonate transport system substrate-binding protein